MIAQLTGTVLRVRIDRAVLSIGGLGLEVFATPNTLGLLSEGSEGNLFTYLVVREDALTLYGFATLEERDTFTTLMSVKGIGPKLALAALAVHTPDSLRCSVADKDLVALQRIPGVGRKSAERMVIEIADKLGTPIGEGGEQVLTGTNLASSRVKEEVVAALTSLGWQAKNANSAVETVFAENSHQSLDVSSVLRAALQLLGGHRG